MHRCRLRSVAAMLVILILSLWVGAVTRAGQGDQDQGGRIQQKMERLQTLVQERQQEGVDPQPVGELMQGFQPLIQEGKFSEAEALLDHALDVANKLGSAPQTGPPPSIERKLHCVQAQVQKWQEEGKDPQPIGDVMQDLQPLVEQKKFAEAEAVLDRAIKLTGEACPDQSTSPQAAGGRGGGGTFGLSQPDPIDFDNHDGWTQIFDGKTLNGWDGTPEVWHVENGAIVGESSPEHPSGTTNIIWRGGEPSNFELKVEMKLEGTGANGGIQYRSLNVPPGPPPQIPADRLAQLTDAQRQQIQQSQALGQKYAKWNMKGYQADFDFANIYTGQLYEQDSPRRIIAWRGQVVEAEQGKKPRLLATLGSSDDLKSFIKAGDWNQYEVIADGNTLTQILNGHVMAVLVDNDPTFSQAKGLIGFEIEGPGVVKISHRNIWLKQLP